MESNLLSLYISHRDLIIPITNKYLWTIQSIPNPNLLYSPYTDRPSLRASNMVHDHDAYLL